MMSLRPLSRVLSEEEKVLDLPDWFDQRERASAYLRRAGQAPDRTYHVCPLGHTAKIIVDIDTGEPVRDADGNLQYYCRICGTKFSVDADGHIVD
jgi:hypothetical protein